MRKREKKVLEKYTVENNNELLTFLLDKKVRKSRNAIKSLLVHKQVKINSKTVSQHNYMVKAGDKVEIYNSGGHSEEKKLHGLSIIYEDDSLVVVDKEAGLLSIGTDKEKRETAYSILSAYLKESDPKARIFILHRLDRDTSGLMFFAKSSEIQEIIQANWDGAVFERSYLAVIEGRMNSTEGTIQSWLTEDKNYFMHAVDFDNGGQLAIMHYKTIKYNLQYSLLQINLETGRKNQIRVQLQQMGHPIVGDKKYGSKTSPIRRLALHASTLSFIHPLSNERLEFRSKLPERMKWLLE